MFDLSRERGWLRVLLLAALPASVILTVATGIDAQQQSPQSQQPATATASSQAPSATQPALTPTYREFKGVRLGMSADEVRRKLGKPKEDGQGQDFFVFSDKERARVYYDSAQKATAIITTFIGKASDAPTPEAVLGQTIQPKTDGSLYELVRYPDAGYWVAYSRTAGDEPLTIITMQAIPAAK